MAASLLDTLKQLVNQGFASTVAERLGESPENVSRGMQGAATSILGGLANKTNDSAAMGQFFSLVSSPEHDFGAAADPSRLADIAQSSGGIRDVSNRFIGDLFGDRASLVNDAVAKSSGLSVPSASAIMQMAAPFVLAFLSRRVKENGLDQSSFTNMLASERDSIMQAAPAGLASALGIERPEREVPVEEPVRDTARETEAEGTYARYRQDARVSGRPRWIWPTVAALAVLALFWGARGRTHAPQRYDTAAGELAPTVGTATPNVTTTTAVRLPDGTTLNVSPTGIEAKLTTFFADSSQAKHASTWYNFDRVTFANNSANLDPGSDEQLSNVAKILAAYPSASVKIAGYTDNTGDAAASKQLSTKRASNVRAALLKSGVAPRRVTAQGYGQEHPIADNSTDAGRAQNNRIALMVVGR